MCWNDVWNMTTTGQITTTPISASAGPIQSNGPMLCRTRRARYRPGAGGLVPRRTCVTASAALLRGVLDRAQHRLRIVRHRRADRLLDLRLHRGPARAAGVLDSLRQRLEERPEHRVGRERRRCRCCGGEQVVQLVELDLVL